MTIEVMLTASQQSVLSGAATRAGGWDALARASVAGERGRAPDPAWAADRPRRAGAEPPPAGVALAQGVLPAASAVALELAPGQRLWITQLEDGQGVDVRAFAAVDGRSFSAAETRAQHGTAPTRGDALLAAPGRPLLTIVADSAPGHDLLYPPCSEAAYTADTGLTGHRGCSELAVAALATLPGRRSVADAAAASDDVLNLWLPTAVDPLGRVRWWPARARAGDVVGLRAEVSVTLAVSTCPDDMFGTSQYEPKPVGLAVLGDPGDSAPVTSWWPAAPPPGAIADRRVVLELTGGERDQLDAMAARGWLGDDRAAVLRAILLRHHEVTRAGD